MSMKKKYPSRHMIGRARQLRQIGTPPEQLLWLALRNGQIAGLKFRRQHPIGPYVVDYYCHGVGLVVELDGISHRGENLSRPEKNGFSRAARIESVSCYESGCDGGS